MATIYNGDMLNKLAEDCNLQTSREKTPTELAEKILPVVNVENKKIITCATGTCSDSLTAGVFNTSATKRTFITGYTLTYSKDVNATATYCALTITDLYGSILNLGVMRFEPLTAGSDSIASDFTFPIEVKKASSVAIACSTNVASIDVSAVIHYYEI